MNEDLMYHIGLSKKDGAKYAILPGDPGRVEKIASFLTNPVHVATNREFTTWAGTICGERVLVTSTGIGGPSTAIAMQELNAIGVDTMVRVGTCGGMNEKVKAGDLIIPIAAVRFDGTSREYVPMEFPAAANYEVLSSLVFFAIKNKINHHVGIVQSKDSFYGQHLPEKMPTAKELEYKWDAWLKAGCLASEMETSTLFTVGSVLGCKCGCVLNAVWNKQDPTQEGEEIHDMTLAIKTAINAIETLIKAEQEISCIDYTKGGY